MTTPEQVQEGRRAERQAAWAAAVDAARAGRSGQRDASTEDGRAAARTAREVAARSGYLGNVLASNDPRVRRASREGVLVPMVGFVDPGWGRAQPDGDVLNLSAGDVVSRAPMVNGVVVPEVSLQPGDPVSVGAVMLSRDGYVGLQWVAEDGSPVYPINWGGGRGPESVEISGPTPAGVSGARMVLAVWSANMAGRPAEARAVMADLAAYLGRAAP